MIIKPYHKGELFAVLMKLDITIILNEAHVFIIRSSKNNTGKSKN